MSQINVSNLTFSYDGSYTDIFDNVSFQIDTDWRLGFVGRNGRGKTTFLKLLMGELEYQGTISKSVNFAFFPYIVHDKSAEGIEIAYNISTDFEFWELKREIGLLGLHEEILYRPFETLSNGEQTKLLLALMFLKEESYLLIDEPTNHLDSEAREIVARYLNSKKNFILVSHDRYFLDSCVDHILSINRSDIVVEKGNFSSWYENKERRDNFEIHENERLKSSIRHLEDAKKQSISWAEKSERSKIGLKPGTEKSIGRRPYVGAKTKKMMKSAAATEKRQDREIAEKSKLLKNLEKIDDLKISPLKHHSNLLFEAKDISIQFGSKIIFENLNFKIENGDRLQLKGKNGSGKTSIVKLIMGDLEPTKGTVTSASGLIISYVPQDTSYLTGNLSNFAEENEIDESLFKTILRKLDFSREQFEKNIEDFSAGQKKKVQIAKSLSQEAHLYIFDEPLNYIDIFSRMQIEKLLLSYMPTMLFIEHDRHFGERVATKILEL